MVQHNTKQTNQPIFLTNYRFKSGRKQKEKSNLLKMQDHQSFRYDITFNFNEDFLHWQTDD